MERDGQGGKVFPVFPAWATDPLFDAVKSEEVAEYHRGRLSFGQARDNVYIVATLRAPYTACKQTLELLEEHIFKQVKLDLRAGLAQLMAQVKDQPDNTRVRRLVINFKSDIIGAN